MPLCWASSDAAARSTTQSNVNAHLIGSIPRNIPGHIDAELPEVGAALKRLARGIPDPVRPFFRFARRIEMGDHPLRQMRIAALLFTELAGKRFLKLRRNHSRQNIVLVVAGVRHVPDRRRELGGLPR